MHYIGRPPLTLALPPPTQILCHNLAQRSWSLVVDTDFRQIYKATRSFQLLHINPRPPSSFNGEVVTRIIRKMIFTISPERLSLGASPAFLATDHLADATNDDGCMTEGKLRLSVSSKAASRPSLRDSSTTIPCLLRSLNTSPELGYIFARHTSPRHGGRSWCLAFALSRLGVSEAGKR